MKLVIDRKKWLRGEGPENSSLLRQKDDKMCCLGFYACALGHTPEQIKGKLSISRLANRNEAAAWLWAGTSESMWGRWETELMTINDHVALHEPYREEEIARIFAKGGIEVEFV